MEIFVSVLAVAIAGSCLIALLMADARDARKARIAEAKREKK